MAQCVARDMLSACFDIGLTCRVLSRHHPFRLYSLLLQPQARTLRNPTNITNTSMCSRDATDKALCCGCVEFLDSGAMLMLRQLTQESTANTSCKSLFDAFKVAEQYTDLRIDTTMYSICKGKYFGGNITAFDEWINSGPNDVRIFGLSGLILTCCCCHSFFLLLLRPCPSSCSFPMRTSC